MVLSGALSSSMQVEIEIRQRLPRFCCSEKAVFYIQYASGCNLVILCASARSAQHRTGWELSSNCFAHMNASLMGVVTSACTLFARILALSGRREAPGLLPPSKLGDTTEVAMRTVRIDQRLWRRNLAMKAVDADLSSTPSHAHNTSGMQVLRPSKLAGVYTYVLGHRPLPSRSQHSLH